MWEPRCESEWQTLNWQRKIRFAFSSLTPFLFSRLLLQFSSLFRIFSVNSTLVICWIDKEKKVPFPFLTRFLCFQAYFYIFPSCFTFFFILLLFLLVRSWDLNEDETLIDEIDYHDKLTFFVSQFIFTFSRLLLNSLSVLLP